MSILNSVNIAGALRFKKRAAAILSQSVVGRRLFTVRTLVGVLSCGIVVIPAVPARYQGFPRTTWF